MHVDGRLRCEQVLVTVEVRRKHHAVLADLGQRVEAEDLESPGIGENRPGPRHELVEPAQRADRLMTGSEEQMVRIRKDDFRVEFDLDIARQHSFERGLRADGHEDGRFDNAVSSVYQSGAGSGSGTGGLEFEVHEEVLV